MPKIDIDNFKNGMTLQFNGKDVPCWLGEANGFGAKFHIKALQELLDNSAEWERKARQFMTTSLLTKKNADFAFNSVFNEIEAKYLQKTPRSTDGCKLSESDFTLTEIWVYVADYFEPASFSFTFHSPSINITLNGDFSNGFTDIS